ncbi:hypothetical protein POM88_025120 [Heracleum sosnowskyi]|uniref:F-box domain-containing protein n=1 Tax=Heracleum sosnowskyi TaxID=360622 RepID=A0AAD8MM52_9APIA|nr:hypothetical protein POM88_025120 [Heracleum sosnowskyi]
MTTLRITTNSSSSTNFVEETIDYYITDAILAEILKGLPIKSLLRCMCVRKSWYHLIKTPMFINLHLNYLHNAAPYPKYLLFESETKQEFLLRYDDNTCKKFRKVKIPRALRHADVEPHGASSGLICLSTIDDENDRTPKGDIYLWNPLIQKYKTLPRPSHVSCPEYCVGWVRLASGYVPQINDYRVVKIIRYDDANKIRNYLESGSSPSLHQFGKSIAFFVENESNNHFKMWVGQQGTGNEFFWEMKISVSLDKAIYAGVLCLRNNGEILLSKLYEFDLVSYNVEKKEVNVFADSWKRWCNSWKWWPSIGEVTDDLLSGVGDPNDFQSPLPFKVYPFVESLALLDTD